MKLIKTFPKTLLRFGIWLSLLGTAFAQTSPPPAPVASPFSPMIYPAKGQTQAQLDTDKAECYAWAKQQTGYDPLTMAQQPQGYPPGTPQPAPYNQPPPSGGAVRGGAKGAAAGAAIGAIAGDAGKGAAIGAGSGAAVGGVRQRRAGEEQQMAQQQAAQQQAAQQPAANQPQFDAFKRAFEACMEGKGYTVKW